MRKGMLSMGIKDGGKGVNITRFIEFVNYIIIIIFGVINKCNATQQQQQLNQWHTTSSKRRIKLKEFLYYTEQTKQNAYSDQ